MNDKQKSILHDAGTEAPYSGALLNEKSEGMFACANCGNQLFDSTAKFDSKTPGLMGWPSFDQALPGTIEERDDTSSGMHRTEAACAKCGSHLGHIFGADDAKTGTHYCINSACLNFKGSDGSEKSGA